MTLEEYQEKVAPILKEYNKFKYNKKNWDYFMPNGYYGIYVYTFEEALKDIESENPRKFNRKKSYFGEKFTDKDYINREWNYKLKGDFDTEPTPPPTPKDLAEQKNEYLSKLYPYFTEDEAYNRVEKDEQKSNKRAVRRAIDNDTYKKLLESGELTEDRLNAIAESVGVRIPKKVFSVGNIKEKEIQEKFNKAPSNVPKQNIKELEGMLKSIKEDFKPLEELVFEKEKERIVGLIDKALETSKKEGAKGVEGEVLKNIPNWHFLFSYKEEKTTETENKYSYNRWDKIIRTYQYVGLELKDGWESVVDKEIRFYVETLKYKLLSTIIDNLISLTKPIKSITRKDLSVGYKGFEGTYRFDFKDGSHFNFVTHSIGAGGYNIQIYHFRYLTKFEDITLANGEKTKSLSDFMSGRYEDGGETEIKTSSSMNDIPTKKVAILFLDIKGSSKLWANDEDTMFNALGVLDEMMVGIVRDNNGMIVKTIGDAFMCSYEGRDGLLNSVKSAYEVQKRLINNPIKVGEERLTARIGVCYGDIYVKNSEIQGKDC
jgi:hypothetical protein